MRHHHTDPFNGRGFGPTSLFDLASAFDRFFDEAPQASRTVHSAAVLTPACDVTETESHFLVTLDMPGVSKDDIRIEAQEGKLFVTAERKAASELKASRHLSERTFGRYHRAFALGRTVDLDRIEALYKDGVLRVALPKAEAAKPRQVKIASEDQSGVFAKAIEAEQTEARQDDTSN